MSPEAAVAWQLGRAGGIEDASLFPVEAVRAYVAARPDPPLPWTPKQAHAVGYRVGLAQGADAIERDAKGDRDGNDEGPR